MAIPKLSRRNFFGASAGAVVAAPKLAQSLTAADPNAIGQGAIGLSSGGYPVPCDPTNDYWLDELKSALRSRKRVKTPTSLGDRYASQVERFRLDGMRSLSPVTRARLAFEHEQRRATERELSYIDERIADLKEKLGPLAAFVLEDN